MGRERTQLNSILGSALHGTSLAPDLTSEATLEPDEKGRLFIGLLNLRTVAERLGEQHWLLTAQPESHDQLFWESLAQSRNRELRPLADLPALFEPFAVSRLKPLGKILRENAHAIVRESLRMPEPEYRKFVRAAAQEMWAFSEFEREWRPERVRIEDSRSRRLAELGPGAVWPAVRPLLEEIVLPEGLFRAFDMMDDILQLQYERELMMENVPETRERIFENSGAGVQTSYATAMVALQALDMRPGETLIDLGSGYGRVGILGGLLREDLQFVGYEFVRHRVECSQNSGERAGLGHVRFHCQDLGDPDFEIPAAAVYYLYDPFNEETYRRVLRRIHAVASRKPVRVVTNADAGAWFQKFMTPERWFPPEIHDGGTLRIFRSRA